VIEAAGAEPDAQPAGTAGQRGRLVLRPASSSAAKSDIPAAAKAPNVAIPDRPPIGEYATIVALFLASRAFLTAIGWFTLRLVPSAFAGQGLLPGLFVRWDSLWYISIASPAIRPPRP